MKKFLCMILALVIFCLSIFSYVYAENITDLQTRQEELYNQLNTANGELEGVQTEISENLEQVQKLDEKIQNSQTELAELNSKIDKLSDIIGGAL